MQPGRVVTALSPSLRPHGKRPSGPGPARLSGPGPAQRRRSDERGRNESASTRSDDGEAARARRRGARAPDRGLHREPLPRELQTKRQASAARPQKVSSRTECRHQRFVDRVIFEGESRIADVALVANEGEPEMSARELDEWLESDDEEGDLDLEQERYESNSRPSTRPNGRSHEHRRRRKATDPL
jgi:hypothetical protein